MKKEKKYGFNSFNKNKLVFIFSIILFVFFFFLSIGFAAFNSHLSITSIIANVRPVTDVRVSDFRNYDVNSGALIIDSDYNISKVYGTIVLPNIDSTATFEVKVTNLGNTKVGISNILNSNNQIIYTINDYTIGDGICNNGDCTLGVTKTFYITLKYNEGVTPSNQQQYFELDFSFDSFSNVSYENIDCTNCKTEALNNSSFSTSIDINESQLKVTMDGIELVKNIDYTYNSSSNILTINEVNGDIVISKVQSLSELKVGDYIAYNALENGNIVITTVTNNATYTDSVTTNPTWRILKINENGEVLITTEDSVSNTKNSWPQSFYLKGKDGYLNGVRHLNEACKKFSNTSYAVYEKGRSINLNDINEINEYVVPNDVTKVYSMSDSGEVLTDGQSSGKLLFNFYDGTDWIDLSDAPSKQVSITSKNLYSYTLKETNVAQRLLKYKGNTTTKLNYWVADTGVLNAIEGYVRYELKCVFNNMLTMRPMYHTYSTQQSDGNLGLRPIVTLKQGLTYTKDSTGVWQISN